MPRRSRSLGSLVVLGGVVGSAVAGALAAACGGGTKGTTFADGAEGGTGDAGDAVDVTSVGDAGDAGRADDTGHAGDTGLEPTCHPEGIVGTTTVPNGIEGGAYYVTTYGVDPTCCRAQLESVESVLPDGGISEGCAFTVAMPCVLDAGGAEGECLDWCASVLGSPGAWSCVPWPSDAGGTWASCVNGSGCGFGRPPRGFVPRSLPAATPLGVHFATMAQLEAASVVAFDALHADLARHGAPASLLRSVLAARRDEVRHARLASREAARHGAVTPAAVVAPIAPRSLEELALANAEEGCVVETFGAAVLALQAERATDPRLRAMSKSIAADELRHAALSWRIADWLDTKLDATGREQVTAARRRALKKVEIELATLPPLGAVSTPKSMIQSLLALLRATLQAGLLDLAS
jgi:hypothetical protein